MESDESLHKTKFRHSKKNHKVKGNKNQAQNIKIIYIIAIIIMILYVYINKKLNKNVPKILSKYQNEIKSEYNKIQELINNQNYNSVKEHIEKLQKLSELLISDITGNDNNKNGSPIDIKNNSAFRYKYYKKFENVFDKFKNETELSEEYKNKLKQDILNLYSSLFHKNYKNIDTIIFSKNMQFGNAMFVINNLIYYCEILGCKYLYISKDYWFIKKPIFNEKLNITISPLINNSFNEETTIDINEGISFDDSIKLPNYNFIPVRTYILKEEILSNVKKIDTDINDLYLNIRSGEDIFENKQYSPGSYFQPPLCFYQTIIETFNFSNIYIVANGKENPVIDELLKLYNNIQYFHGNIEEDAGMVISAKNLAMPTSSFTTELIKLNDNLKNLFIFDSISEKDKEYWHFQDRHLRPLKFNMFIMNPSKEYMEIMNPWRQDPKQFEQMISEKCNKHFNIIPSDFI